MKQFIKIFLVIAVIVSSFTFSSVQNSEAATSANVTISSANQNFGLQFVRVIENNVRFIYIYTAGGIYITKIEEL